MKIRTSCLRKLAGPLFLLGLLVMPSAPAVAADVPAAQPAQVKYRVMGLFSPDRPDDLREVLQKLPELKLVSIDYPNAEGVFSYDPAKAFPGAKPEEITAKFDNLLRSVSNATFGIKPVCTLPKEKLTRLEIPVVGLDCKGCSFGAYDSIAGIDGVELATASFKAGLVTAVIDPTKTNREALETALKARGVQLKSP